MKIDEMRKIARQGGLITPKRKEKTKPVTVKYTKVCESDGCSNRVEPPNSYCDDCEGKMKSSGVKGLPMPCGPAHYGSVAATCLMRTGFERTCVVGPDYFAGAKLEDDEEDKKADSDLDDIVSKFRFRVSIPGTLGWAIGPKKEDK